MELISQYSGIFAIIVYSLILAVVLKIARKKQSSEEPVKEEEAVVERTLTPLNIEDEDALVACLVASIECRNEEHKNVRIVSVREV